MKETSTLLASTVAVNVWEPEANPETSMIHSPFALATIDPRAVAPSDNETIAPGRAQPTTLVLARTVLPAIGSTNATSLD